MAVQLIPMPSALLSHILLTQDLRHKQVGIPDHGRSIKICHTTRPHHS
jgi:hypothetical protein